MACKRLGYTHEELLSMTPADIERQDLVEDRLSFLSETIKKNHGQFEAVHVAKDGTQIPVEINSHFFHLNGKPVLLDLARDITERKKAEALLQKSEKRYRSLFMNLYSAFAYQKMVKNEAGELCDFEYILVNESFGKLTGYSTEDLPGMRVKEIISEKVFEQHRSAYEAVLLRGESCFFEEQYYETFGKWCSVALYSPEPGFLAVVLNDIDQFKKTSTELMRAKDDAEKANRAKSEFLANMSHEIRTPINGIVGMIDLTMLTELSQEQQDNLNTAKSCADSLLKIINDILDFSKMEAGKLVVDRVDFDIKNLLDEVTKTHAIKASGKGLELLYAFSSNIPPYLVGDPNRLQQVLNNLISNAIKFTDQGDVSVEVRKLTQNHKSIELQFSVKDSGIGISAQDRNLLFKSFSQIDGSYTRRFGGTGLGLVISKQIVEMMGGSIDVKSELQKGSTFSFTLPFTIGSKPLVQNSYLKKPEKSLQILIAEDDQVNQLVLSRMLQKRGYRVGLANNGMEAVRAFERGGIDLILMDIQMPEMDGIEAMQRIRSQEEKGPYTPIIALTAYALKGDREKFLSLGMDEYIAKPISMPDLFETIDRLAYNEHRRNSSEFEVSISEDGTLLLSRPDDYSPVYYDPFSMEQVERKMTEFHKHIEDEDLWAIEREANYLKNLFNRMDAEELKSTAFRIELSAKRCLLQDVVKYIQQLERELSVYKKSLAIKRRLTDEDTDS
jgi:PAS domain S-box-containing protein